MYLLLASVGIFIGLITGYVEPNCYNPPADLCDVEISEIPSLESRDPSIMYSNTTSCDLYAIDINQWYRSESNMSTSCPSMYSCGTKFPIWMDGINPSINDGLVNRTACVNYFGECCLDDYRLTAVNCGGYMAYCFVDLPSSCQQRYCFDHTGGNQGTTEAQQNTNKASETTTSTTPTTGFAGSNCFRAPSDICSGKMSHIPSLETRSPSYAMNEVTSNSKMCDLHAIDTNTWYRSESNMSTSCPFMYTCGAKHPLWMNGLNPTPEDGLVNRTSCVRDFDTCCYREYRITAINCREFMAYCFVEFPSSCDQRYCFDYTHTSTTTTTSMSTGLNTGKPSSTTGENQTPTPGFTSPKSKDAKVLTIALVVIGLVTAAIFGVLTFIIRRNRMTKVNDKEDEINEYDTLRQPSVNVIDVKDAEHIYRTISLKAPGIEVHGKEHIGEQRVNVIPWVNPINKSDGEYETFDNDEKGLYDDENHYVKMP